MNFRLGTFSFLTHRITGITLVVSGIIMLLGLSVIMFGRVAFAELLITLKLPFFVIVAHFLAITLFWHVLNGVKILLIDIFKLGRIQEILTLVILVAFVFGLVLYFVYVFPSPGVA
jgi:succinate dehydrogenase / fumarate reductase cytochrome b subunit